MVWALFLGCQPQPENQESKTHQNLKDNTNLHKYTSFKLTTDLTALTPNQKKMIPILIETAKIMDDLFWYEAYGDRQALLNDIKDPDDARTSPLQPLPKSGHGHLPAR